MDQEGGGKGEYDAWTPEGQTEGKGPTRRQVNQAMSAGLGMSATGPLVNVGGRVESGLRLIDAALGRFRRRGAQDEDPLPSAEQQGDEPEIRAEFEQHQQMGRILIPGLGKSAEILHVKNTPGVRELGIDPDRQTWGFLDFPVDKTGQLEQTDWPGSYSYDPDDPHHIASTGSNTVIISHNVSMYENPNGVFNQLSYLNPGDLVYIVNDNELEVPQVSVFVVDARPSNSQRAWEIVPSSRWQVTARPPEREREFEPPPCRTTPCIEQFDPLDVIHRLTMFTCVEDPDNPGHEDPDRRLMVTARLAVQFDCADPFNQDRLLLYRRNGSQIVEGAQSFGNVLTWLMEQSGRMGDELWWPRGVHPEMDARLDPEFHSIMGTPEGDDYLSQLYNQYGFGVRAVG